MVESTRYFECQRCGTIIKQVQPNQSKYVKQHVKNPDCCYEEQGGCGRTSKFLEVTIRWVVKNRSDLLE